MRFCEFLLLSVFFSLLSSLLSGFLILILLLLLHSLYILFEDKSFLIFLELFLLDPLFNLLLFLSRLLLKLLST